MSDIERQRDSQWDVAAPPPSLSYSHQESRERDVAAPPPPPSYSHQESRGRRDTGEVSTDNRSLDGCLACGARKAPKYCLCRRCSRYLETHMRCECGNTLRLIQNSEYVQFSMSCRDCSVRNNVAFLDMARRQIPYTSYPIRTHIPDHQHQLDHILQMQREILKRSREASTKLQRNTKILGLHEQSMIEQDRTMELFQKSLHDGRSLLHQHGEQLKAQEQRIDRRKRELTQVQDQSAKRARQLDEDLQSLRHDVVRSQEMYQKDRSDFVSRILSSFTLPPHFSAPPPPPPPTQARVFISEQQ